MACGLKCHQQQKKTTTSLFRNPTTSARYRRNDYAGRLCTLLQIERLIARMTNKLGKTSNNEPEVVWLIDQIDSLSMQHAEKFPQRLANSR